MAETQAKRLPLPALILGVLILVGCAAFGAGKYLERTQIKQLNELLASLPEEYGFSAEEIDGSLFGRTLTLKRADFTLLSEDGEPIAVSIGAASGEGLSLSAPFVPGTTTLADRLTLTDVAITDKDGTLTAGRIALSGVRADVSAIRNFLKEIKKYTNSDDYATNAEMWKRSGLDTLGIAGIEGADLRFSAEDDDAEIPSIAIGFLQIAEYSILSTGPVAVRDITVSLGGEQVAAIGEAGLKRLVLPDPDDFEKLERLNDVFSLGKLELKRDIRLDDLFFRQLAFSPTMPDGSVGRITLAQAGMSLGYTNGRLLFSVDTDALTVEKKLLALGEDALDKKYARVQEILQYLPETIVYTSRIAMDISVEKNDGGTTAIKPIMVRIDDFGSVELLLDMEYAAMAPKSTKVKAFEVTLSDSGASEFIFSMMGRESGQSAEQMRNQSILSLITTSAFAQGSLKKLVENLGTFMEKPGATFTAKMSLPKPLDADTLGMQLLMAPDSLGLTSSVSRENAGPGKP